jgi:electron transfer flavoprotein alpha subunit
VVVLLAVAPDESVQRQALGQLRTWFGGDVILLPDHGDGSDMSWNRLLGAALAEVAVPPLAVVGEPWTGPPFARLAARDNYAGGLAAQVHCLNEQDGRFVLETVRARGKLRTRQTRTLQAGRTLWITLAEDAPVIPVPSGTLPALPRVERWTPRPKEVYGRDSVDRLVRDLQNETGLTSLRDAEFIIDVGFGIGNRDGYEAVVEPLERALGDLGVRRWAIGGSRKVTEELRLFPVDRQIGQSGASVNPRILLAIGISGAPQHLNYIGQGASILAFNRDPDAPLMTLNQRQPRPRVFPVVGDLFETVPAFIAALCRNAEPSPAATATDDAPPQTLSEHVLPPDHRVQ